MLSSQFYSFHVFKSLTPVPEGVPWWLRWYRICLQCGQTRLDPWVVRFPWRREWQPTSVLLPREFHGRGAWQATVQWVTKSQTQLSNEHSPSPSTFPLNDSLNPFSIFSHVDSKSLPPGLPVSFKFIFCAAPDHQPQRLGPMPLDQKPERSRFPVGTQSPQHQQFPSTRLCGSTSHVFLKLPGSAVCTFCLNILFLSHRGQIWLAGGTFSFSTPANPSVFASTFTLSCPLSEKT